MQKLALLTVVAALAVSASGCSRAWAGEGQPLGVIIVSDGGTACNFTTGYGAITGKCDGGSIPSGRCFGIPPLAKLTIQTDEGCYVGSNVAGCDAGMCLKLTAGQMFPTSVKTTVRSGKYFNWDGGASLGVTLSGSWVCASPPSGTGECHAYVYERDGTE